MLLDQPFLHFYIQLYTGPYTTSYLHFLLYETMIFSFRFSTVVELPVFYLSLMPVSLLYFPVILDDYFLSLKNLNSRSMNWKKGFLPIQPLPSIIERTRSWHFSKAHGSTSPFLFADMLNTVMFLPKLMSLLLGLSSMNLFQPRRP